MKTYLGVCNIGINLQLTKHPRLEVHILDFDEDIYGKNQCRFCEVYEMINFLQLMI